MADETPVLDRGKVTYKQRKRATLIPVLLQRAQRDLDAETMEALYEETDRIVMSAVVSVPAGWLPKGVTVASPGWLDALTGDQYDALIAALQPEPPGEKKG